jgi:streptogramin lyase
MGTSGARRRGAAIVEHAVGRRGRRARAWAVAVLVVQAVLWAALAPPGTARAAFGDITEFPLSSFGSFPAGIAAGPDGNLWFTESGAQLETEVFGNKIGRITPAGVITEFPLPTPSSFPYVIAAGPDGNLWFTESGSRQASESGNRIGRITPAGVVTEFPLPTADSYPLGIAAGPDGNLWFTEQDGNRIGRITPAGVITEFPLPTPRRWPSRIAAGPDGNLWFTESGGNRIGRITPAGVITEFPLPTPDSGPAGIAAGPDGNLWFTEQNAEKIGRITPAGAVTEFPLPPITNPVGIAAGPDGNLWFTNDIVNKIGRITPAGAVTEFPLPSGGGALGIAAGPDGNLWFTEFYGDRIGRFELRAPAPVPTIFASVVPAANAAGWHNAASVAVTLTAAAGAGGAAVQSITYSATGAQPIASTTVAGASAVVPFTAEGVTTLSYSATDRAGNRSATKSLAIRIDRTAPLLSAKDVLGTDGAYLGSEVVAQDRGSGLVRIEALKLVNARPAAPMTLPRVFSPPTTDTVTLRIVPVDPAKPVGFTLRAVDAAGNARTVDPVVVLVARERGKPVATTVELAPGERWVDVMNGDPGLTHLRLTVNGRRYEVNGLNDGEVRTLDVGAALRASGNTATLEARGKPGGRATVVLHD